MRRMMTDDAGRDKALRELRELSRELVAMGAGDLAALVEDARVRLAREAWRERP